MTAGHPLAAEPGPPSPDVHEETSPRCAGGQYRRHSNAIDVTPPRGVILHTSTQQLDSRGAGDHSLQPQGHGKDSGAKGH
jgi:hypothetical protein